MKTTKIKAPSEKMVFGGFPEVFLKKKELKPGCFYLYKDGRLVLYLGRTDRNELAFYQIASCLYCPDPENKHKGLTLAHYDSQVNYLIALSDDLLKKSANSEYVLCLKTMPSLYCEFKPINFEKGCKDWYIDSMKTNSNLPTLTSVSNVKANRGFVAAKDLVPGRIYYSGCGWRSMYMYLGRDTETKEFLWYFIGNEEYLLHLPTKALFADADRTKSNKKVKSLFDAGDDKDVWWFDGLKMLYDMKYAREI